MRKFVIGSVGIFLGAFFLFGYFYIFPAASAQKVARLQWEYASIRAVYSPTPAQERINKIFGVADICYMQATGCKTSEVKHEIDYGQFLVERGLVENLAHRNLAGLHASELALQKALAQMGSEGWELVGEPDLEFERVSVDNYNRYENKSLLFTRYNSKAIYFKRARTQ